MRQSGSKPLTITRRAFAAHPALRRIEALVHPDNAGSARVLEKAGYARDGRRADGRLVFAKLAARPRAN